MGTPDHLRIRRFRVDDLNAVTKIYNHYVSCSNCTLDLSPLTPDEAAKKFVLSHQRPDDFPVLVLLHDERLIGYASLAPFAQRGGYFASAEASIYVADGCRGQGNGRLLLHALSREGAFQSKQTILALITHGNTASTRLFEASGFTYQGSLRAVGQKFGQRVSLDIFQYFPGA